MQVLIACEESQEVCKAFRKLGHEAYSCDILMPSGGHREWHIRQDVITLIKCTAEDWDMMIAHPPCTHLSVSGARYFKEKIEDGRQQQAIDFFMELINAKIPKIVVENPVGIMSTKYKKPDQYIQPYEHGHKISKKTGLWLKNLPLLKPTKIVEPEWVYYKNGGRCSPDHYKNAFSKDRAKLRSKTYPGIAKAMAEQWG